MARAPVQQEDELLPEADRLEGFPHPRETATLFGHEDAERDLVEGFASDRMHHAWLVAGPLGIGKAISERVCGKSGLLKKMMSEPVSSATRAFPVDVT